MKIAFIGYGNMARALAGKWRDSHDLFFSGRSPDKAAAAAADHASGSGSMADGVAFADVVVLATHNSAVFDAIDGAGGAAAFAGKTVLDINNPISVENFLTTMDGGGSLTVAIAKALPDAQVAKAFNMAQARVWADSDMTYDGRKLVTPFTADTSEVASIVAGLIEDVGSRALHVGGNEYAYQLEAAGALVIKQLFSGKPHDTVLNFIEPDVKPR